jgi:hypothetical protein
MRLLPLVIVMLSFVFAPVSLGQTAPATRHDDVQLDLMLLREGRPLEVGDQASIPLELRFTNRSPRAVSIPWGDTLYDDLVRFSITGPDGKALAGPLDRAAPPILTRESYIEVPAGGTVSWKIFLGSFGRNCQRWYFRIPGEYLVHAQFAPHHPLAADPATGAVTPVANAWQGTVSAAPIKVAFGEDPEAVEGTSRLTGTILDADGKPLAGALVRITRVRAPEPGQIIGTWDNLIRTDIDRRMTDAQGHFVAEGVPARAIHFDLKVTHPQFVPGETTVKNRLWPGELETTVQLSAGVALSGRVTDEGGRPLHGVSIRNYPADAVTFSGPDGRFTSPPAPRDNLHLDLFFPGYALLDTHLIPPEEAGKLHLTLTRAPRVP